ncbi:MAG: hypothetical protein EON59_06755 [Alphaproteobacteria bacterium]|nr:MAG: hypothetical protein EON59_06755 [Alphaproteobacteria bacterium]
MSSAAAQQGPPVAAVVRLMSDICVPYGLGSSARVAQFKAEKAGYKPLPNHAEVLSGPLGHITIASTPKATCTILVSPTQLPPQLDPLLAAAVGNWSSTSADGPFTFEAQGEGWSQWTGIVSDEINVLGERVLMVEVERTQ